MGFFLAAVFGVFFCAIIGMIVGSTKGRPVAGFFLGGLFGPIGLVIVLLLDRKISSMEEDPFMPRYTRDYRAESASASTAPTSAAPSSAIPHATVEALLDLKRLLDSGVITQAEFDARKKDMLAPQPAVPSRRTESSVRYKGLND
jgi:hypothetical protein